MGKKKTQIEKSDTKVTTVDSVHDSIQGESSEANQAAIDAKIAADTKQQKEKSSTADKDGVIFNPELHAVDKDGNPSLTSTGKFRKRRGISKVAVKGEAEKTVQDEQAARAAGILCADMMIGSAVTLLGEEWVPIGSQGQQQPIKFDEHSNLRRAFGDYFVARGIKDFPPGIMLTIALTSYAAPRLVGGQETKTKLSKVKKWFGAVIKKVKGNATQSDSRDNGKRKNDISSEAVRPEHDAGTRHSRT